MITVDPVTYAILIRETETTIPVTSDAASVTVIRRSTEIPLADGLAQVTVKTVEAPRILVTVPMAGPQGAKGDPGEPGDGAADPGDFTLIYENKLI